MNLNKARDFYSAYYEGTLDDGLSQAFERAMSLDAAVGAEYAQFVRIMGELKALQTPVEVPADLHLKIRERVDAHIIGLEGKSRGAARFFAWRPIAYGAVATLAIIGAIASISNVSDRNRVEVANFVPSVEAAPRIVFTDGAVRLTYTASGKNSVTVTKLGSGQVLFARSLNGQGVDSPLSNHSDGASVVSVSFARDYATMYVAVPGSKVSTKSEGAGTAVQFAAAVASRYAVPVVIESGSPDATVVWRLESTDPLSSIVDEMKALGLKAEVREGGLIWVSAN